MSDRISGVVRVLWLSVILAVAAGCERTETTSQSDVVSVAPVETKTAESSPLLLLDEPANAASGGAGVDNSRCFVCHVNYMQEKLAVGHAKVNVGCAKCHGASDAHIADESWASGGNGTAPDVMFPRDKIDPACMTCHAREKLSPALHQAFLAAPGAKVCTDCHNTHRLPQRRCKWK